jgi:hypothetical protein
MEDKIMSVLLNCNIKIVERARKLNTKVSEEYVHVEFTYPNDKKDIWVPVEYRRTGISIKPDDIDGLYEHLNKIYPQMNPSKYSSWLKTQDEFWAKSNSDVTKPIFDILKDGKWHCRNCDIKNANFARRIQDLKEMGYTIATRINYKCPVCHNNRSTRLLLLPIDRVEIAGNGYETWSHKLRKRIISVLGNYDVYEATVSQHLLPDHKFSEIRWDENTKTENPDTMTNDEIKEKFQLLSNQRNQQKREVCQHCFQSGKRGSMALNIITKVTKNGMISFLLREKMPKKDVSVVLGMIYRSGEKSY